VEVHTEYRRREHRCGCQTTIKQGRLSHIHDRSDTNNYNDDDDDEDDDDESNNNNDGTGRYERECVS